MAEGRRSKRVKDEMSLGSPSLPLPLLFPYPMDAMILAAGLCMRLHPLTNHMPRALVEVASVPMLEHVARGC